MRFKRLLRWLLFLFIGVVVLAVLAWLNRSRLEKAVTAYVISTRCMPSPPAPPGKDYRLLKIVTQPASAEQSARLGNDRAPVVRKGA